MKIALLELWIEHKNMPFVSIAKILVLICLLGMGVIVKGYPYSIAFLVIVLGLQSTSVFFYGQIKLFLPQTKQQQKKVQVQKSAYIASIYSIATVLGYIAMIHVTSRYHWDMESILGLFALCLISFLSLFRYQLFLERISLQKNVNQNRKKNLHFYKQMILEEGYLFLAIGSLMIFIFYKFAQIKELQFFQNQEWQAGGMCFLYATMLGAMIKQYRLIQAQLKLSNQKQGITKGVKE